MTGALLLVPILLVEPVWLEGPAAVPGAPPGRNPALAAGGGRVHAVFRVRTQGVGHMVAGTGEAFAGATVIAGSNAAAVQGNKNYPALAVDAAGVGHVAWGPPSGPGNGAWFVRVDGDGAPIGAAEQVTGKWIESIAVGVTADEVHVLVTAIKEMEQPDALDGVFDLHGPLGGGALVETEAWQFPNFTELSVAPAPWGGLAVLARWDVLKRIDLMGGVWTNFENVEVPAGTTSVGRPQHVYGDVELWAAVGWIDATPNTIEVRTGGPKQPWTTLASGLFDPASADGEPAVALASGEGDERMVAWLAAEGPRLQVALAVGAWGTATALPGTEMATSFAMGREGPMDYRVVFAAEDGTLYAGRVGVAMDGGTTGAETGETTTGGTGAGTTGGSSMGETSMGETSGAWTESTESTPTGGGATGMSTSVTGVPSGDATEAGEREDAGGCGCSTRGPRGWMGLAVGAVMLLRRRRR